ncbi:MAG: hypothetical protein M5R36_02290 [Deltaproteobacteria bacterium]|nr:hypothetical protein [Deltaproteobacteria bacterium]
MTLAVVVLAAVVVASCAAKESYGPDAQGLGNQDTLMREPLNDPPSYGLFHNSLEFYEKKLGMSFYKNSKDRYQPYAAQAWSSFFRSPTGSTSAFTTSR